MKHCVVFFIVCITVFCNASSSDTDGTDAETYFNRGIEKHNNASQLHAKLDNTRFTDPDYATEFKEQVQSQYKEAITHFDKAIELNPDYARAYYYRGLATYRIGEYTHKYKHEWEEAAKKILPYFDKAIELSSTIEYLAEAYYMRGLLKARFKVIGEEVGEVITDFDKTILWKPDFAEAYFQRGKAHIQFGGDQQRKRIAIADFEKAIQLKTSFAIEAYIEMGALKVQLGRYRSAIKDYDEAIELDPNPESYLLRGYAKLKLGEHDAAIADYDEAVQISFEMIQSLEWTTDIPDNLRYRRSLKNRIIAKFEIGRYISAIEDCDKHIQAYSSPRLNSDIYYLRGNARVRLHQYEAAMEDYEKGLQIALSEKIGWLIWSRDFYKLGLVKWKLGLYEQARADFEEALRRTEYEKKDLLEIEDYENPFLEKIRGVRWNLREGSNNFSYKIYGETRTVNIDEELKEYTTVKF